MRRETNDESRIGRQDVGEWLGWTVLVAAVGLLCAGLIWSQRKDAMREEEQRMTGQTNVIGHNLVRQLGAVRSVLGDVRATILQRDDGCATACQHAAMHALRGAMPGVRVLMLVERGGQVVFADAEPGEPAQASRGFLADLHRAVSPDIMYLSASIEPGHPGIEVRAALPLAAHGAGRGQVLVAILDPQYFDVAMRSALYASDMTSAVTSDDGTRLLFVPYDRQLPVYDAPGHTAFYVRHLRSGASSTVMQGPLGKGGELRLVAQRTVDAGGLRLDRTLVVSVSRSMAAVRAPWRRSLWMCGAAWIVLVSAGSIALYLRQRRRRWLRAISQQQEAERIAGAERIELALDGAKLGVWELCLQTDRVQLDVHGLAMLGYTASDQAPMDGRWLDQVHPEDRPGVERARRRAACQGGVYDVEYRMRHHGGHWIWLLSRGKVVARDGAGAASRLAGTHMDIGARKQAEAEIVRLAFYDGLTGLPNRRLLLDRIAQALAKSDRARTFGAVLFLDLDNFKSLNDTLGHQAGDSLLKRVAMRLQDATRDTDTVARLGGDEFVVLLEGLGSSAGEAARHAQRVADKILHALGLPHTIGGHDIRSTPSVGIAMFGAGTHSVDDLIKQADMAMYEAKAAGRNAARLFDPAMQVAADQGVVLEAGLRHALAARQFVLYYQPVFDQDGGMVGAEALVRWQRPGKGIVGPAEFICQAEKSDLIVEIGDWVLEAACRQLAAWQSDAATRTLTVAVNISARQARRPDFVERVLAVLSAAGADPRLLKLELTESMLLADVDDIAAKMRRLKAQGIGLALDDFGTGYSSLSYLARLPLTQLKIDRSFVRDMLVTPNAATIVQTIVTLARQLQLDVVAEGVENEQQRAALIERGCTSFQGFLFAAPGPVEALRRWHPQAVALAEH
ncbi:EAL domain-containing protein [Massilia sp. YIM B02763]|uniref:putative bifunctional diguanylate cyclase/phosphodiesterase n=1 Tax=Massilia sp. YIM B02763 TaxID=3050130 RepID=UPI0025B70781|nr:EAL domain-containing protein [Massilia sp. YIM B02763]MDN4052043.1 EAL domain-containing protein [Massilia sp. YIM B02763]